MKNLGPIYLLRHGETIWNRAKRLQGHKDTPLTLKGVNQARALGKALRKTINTSSLNFFYSSPIGRAKQTATIIADEIGFNTETIIYTDKLREITFGAWDGLNMQEILSRDKPIWEKRKGGRWQFSPPKGESYEHASKRALSFLTDTLIGGPTIIVAHGSLNKVIRGNWRELSSAETLALDEPQDGFYCLKQANLETFIPA